MDLQTFSVSQKLQNGSASDLLDYVIKEEAIPYETVKKTFEPLIANMSDAQASLLVESAIDYVKSEAPVSFTPRGDRFDASSEINDGALEAMQLIHHVDGPTIFKRVAEETMLALNPDKQMHMGDIEQFTSEVKQTTAAVQERLQVNEPDLQESVVYKEPVETVSEMTVPEIKSEQPTQSFNVAPLPKSTTLDNQQSVNTEQAAMKKAYEWILNELKKNGLSDRLNLAI